MEIWWDLNLWPSDNWLCLCGLSFSLEFSWANSWLNGESAKKIMTTFAFRYYFKYYMDYTDIMRICLSVVSGNITRNFCVCKVGQLQRRRPKEEKRGINNKESWKRVYLEKDGKEIYDVWRKLCVYLGCFHDVETFQSTGVFIPAVARANQYLKQVISSWDIFIFVYFSTLPHLSPTRLHCIGGFYY